MGAAAAITLHVAAGAAVLAYEPARTALSTPAAIAVQWITAPPIEEPAPAPTPTPKPSAAKKAPSVRPKPMVQQATPAPAPAPEPVAAPAQPPPPPPAPVAAVAEPAPAPPPVTVSAPIYNADYLANPAPAYPALSRRTGEQGRVILRVHVTPAGTVDDVEVRTSSGHSRLDESALETVKRWKFIPAKRGPEPVAAWVLVPISFGLES